MKTGSGVRWGAAIAGMLVAEAGQIVATIAWVAFYSYVVHPGESQAFYESHARQAGPWVSLLAGTPIFYFVCRWIAARSGSRGLPTAMALFAFFAVVDGAMLLAAGPLSPRLFAVAGALYLLKLAACWLGGRSGSRTRRRSEVAEPA